MVNLQSRFCAPDIVVLHRSTLSAAATLLCACLRAQCDIAFDLVLFIMSLSTITLGQGRLARAGLENPARQRVQRQQRSRTAFVCEASQRRHAEAKGIVVTPRHNFTIRRAWPNSSGPAASIDTRRHLSRCAGLPTDATSLSLSLASLLVALSADAATSVEQTVQSTAAKLPSPPPASTVLQPSSIDTAVSSVVDAVRVCPRAILLEGLGPGSRWLGQYQFKPSMLTL